MFNHDFRDVRHTHNFRKFSPQAFTQTQTSKSFACWKTVNKPVLVIDL